MKMFNSSTNSLRGLIRKHYLNGLHSLSIWKVNAFSVNEPKVSNGILLLQFPNVREKREDYHITSLTKKKRHWFDIIV